MLWSQPSFGYQMPPEFYNKLFTMHATIMIFFVIIPLLTGAFGNFLIPLMIGARDMAFPRLNALGFWATLFGGLLVYSSFATGGAPAIGWFAYAPL
ncbi:MAG: cbb3-type cytochrome c oxidase subunit I, partial [Nostoc sp.]